jgi:hypothetical protein
MNIINFLQYRTKIGIYYSIVKLDGVLDDLACLLAHEIGGEKNSSWIDFLYESTYQQMSGNEIILEKKEMNVYIGNLYYNSSIEEYDKLKISILELLKLIKTWEVLLDKEAKEISLIHKNGKFELIEKNDSEEIAFE